MPPPCAVFVRTESPQVNWMRCLARVNKQLSQQGLKRANGKYVSCDTTLISSARSPRKKLEGEEIDQDSDQANTFGYSMMLMPVGRIKGHNPSMVMPTVK